MKNDKCTDLFSEKDLEDIKQAIMTAELDTSGEIRVHIEENCEGDPNIRAKEVFEEHNMQETRLQNAVLFYVAFRKRKFAIYTDKGIKSVVPMDFWDLIKRDLLNSLREGCFVDGLFDAILTTGVIMKKHFPRQKDDKNQLPDEVILRRG